MEFMSCDTYWVKIYIAGPIEVAKQIIRLHTASVGLCVTIDPTTYIYTGGEEAGYVVGLINYPRFPSTPDELDVKAAVLASALRAGTGQSSYTIMTPTTTKFFSYRAEMGSE